MKRFFKWIGVGLVAIIALGGSFAAHEWYADKPFYFNNFLNREMVKVAFDSPETLTSLGFLESVGIKGHNAKLDDASPEKSEELYNKARNIKSVIENYDDDDLSKDELLSKKITLYLLDYLLTNEPFQYHTYPVNQLFGVQNGYPSFMQGQHQIKDETDVENYLSRLEAVDEKFAQVLEGLKLREDKGIIPPRFVIERVLDEMNGFISSPLNENILYSSLKEKMADIESLSQEQQDDFLAKAEARINDDVNRAYQLFIDYFTTLKTKAGTDDGYWHLPDGDKVYANALRFFTTTDMTADEIHNIGLKEVARIQGEMLKILADEGYDTSQGFTTAMDALASDPSHYYEDSDAGREQILKDYQIILDEIEEDMSEVFRIRPKAGMEVVRIPEFKEKTAPGAYYQQPAIDGSRPGRFFTNLYDIKATPKYSMRTLAYHEGIPGHHFQIALAMEIEGMPFIRKMSPFTAYTEGWALYSEYLAWEMGFQDNPLDNLGRLQAELFRAVRLVVDTGIHDKRWTREEAIDYMVNNTGMALSDVTSEIERYIVMPGQATSYKVGMLKILELREKAKNALGDKFDLRDFHDVVLKNGAVPLSILEELIDEYIEAKRT
ncbi:MULTISPECIES: DUF885 domain-containing protein [unclassified Alteromonas]|jgi:uncharacterized protein (DUF885 family)|uniref:DUF885 domain-containing protein n=1 Tax=unclassified Alteromonas TaxID=2614992 RepID=UPI0005099CDD|nr:MULTISPECIES: DUF885 domain-containing protein [unclassified Alteromonas]MAI38757.1 DUF885 domain-containing protein [Alteromonas sp.]OUX85280.1 MAG: DUF885 domain-containing protein [Alteromonas sp. TMED35]|tara:strand:+ start:11785 stop:13605 length:1821 start_codon:yes stop_codon:yes gene_type:complete